MKFTDLDAANRAVAELEAKLDFVATRYHWYERAHPAACALLALLPSGTCVACGAPQFPQGNHQSNCAAEHLRIVVGEMPSPTSEAIEPGRVYWFAETVEPPPRYAFRPAYPDPVEVSGDATRAIRFETRDECLAFCCSTFALAYLPPLTPREHMFFPPTKAETPQDGTRGEAKGG